MKLGKRNNQTMGEISAKFLSQMKETFTDKDCRLLSVNVID